MNGFSRVILVGYLGQDPESKTSKTGSNYVRLSIATHHSRKREDGGWDQASTQWHRVMVWGNQASVCAKNLLKGAPVMIEGHIDQYKYQKEGGEVIQSNLVADRVHFLPNPKQIHMQIADEEIPFGEEVVPVSA